MLTNFKFKTKKDEHEDIEIKQLKFQWVEPVPYGVTGDFMVKYGQGPMGSMWLKRNLLQCPKLKWFMIDK